MSSILEPQKKLSKNTIIGEAEKHSSEDGAIAFARGVRWTIRRLLPLINDYNRQKIRKLIE